MAFAVVCHRAASCWTVRWGDSAVWRFVITSLGFWLGDLCDRVPGVLLSVEGESDASEHVRAGLVQVSFDAGQPRGGDSDVTGEVRQAVAALLTPAPDPSSPRLHNGKNRKQREVKQALGWK